MIMLAFTHRYPQPHELTLSVFLYHSICQNDTQRLCFYDENYLRICQSDHYRAEYFGHDIQLDHCNNCLADGRCVQGDLNHPNDFFCICFPSYYGHHCEFNSKPFSTTTDSFHSSTSTAIKIVYDFCGLSTFHHWFIA
jgi:hypothetical protein